MMAAAAAAAVASAATVSPGLVPPPPGQKVLSVRHYEAGPPLPEGGEGTTLAKGKDANGNAEVAPADHCETSSPAEAEDPEATALCLPDSEVPGSEAAVEPLEEEWVTRKRVELTTTRQTETRVKRQVEVDEEGRVVGDSGPIVTTNTTEDTRSEEKKHTEHRAVGPDDEPLPPLEGAGGDSGAATKSLVASAEDVPEGAVVREVRERTVKSREEREEVCETEDVVHLGDITDEGYLAAVRDKKDVRTAAAVDSKAVTPEGPRIIRQTAKGHKVVDTEDTEEAILATPDGRLLTETKSQQKHEEEDVVEDDDGKDLPDEEVEGEGKSHNYVRTKEEEVVAYLSNGVKIAEEMKYRAEGFEGEKEGGDETDAPPRLRALKPRTSGGGGGGGRVHPPSPPGGERKDALTKKPLDLDAEEETRKVETSKWLEHHFGSDSRSSREGSAGGFEDSESSPFYPGATPGGGSYIGITMKSKTNNVIGKDGVTPTDIREPLRSSPLPSPIKPNGLANGYSVAKAPEPPPPMPTTNGYAHHHSETEVTRISRTSSGGGGQGIIGRKDVIQVLPTGPGRTFRPPRGVAAPPPSATELTHVEPQKRKKRPPPQPSWTAEANGEEGERVEGRASRPWSPEEDGRRGSGDDHLIGRNMSPNFLSGPKPYRPSTLSSPSDHSWNNRTEEATVSWANGATEHHQVMVTNGDGHHHHGSTGHLASPVPPPQEGVRVARTRRRAPPIPGAPETNGVAQESHVPVAPAMSPLEKKQSHQKTRFADEEEDEDDEEEIIDVGRDERANNKKANKKVKKKKSGSFGESIRRLVGRLRSRSSEKKKGKEEQAGRQNGHHQPPQQQKAMSNGHGNIAARRGSWRSSSRSPSPDEYGGEQTYRRYQSAIDGNIRPSSLRRQQQQQEEEEERQQRSRGDLNGRHHHHHHRSVGVRRESSPNEATSEEEVDEVVDGREGVGVVVGGPVAPPRSRPATTTSSSSYQGHLPVTQQLRSLQAEIGGVGGGSYRHQQSARGHHHVRGTRQSSQAASRRAGSPANRQSNETSSRGDTDRSWKGSSGPRGGRRDYGAESSGGGRRRNSAYSPERGPVFFSSTNSEGEGGRRREADRVPPLLATSTPMDYDKKHSSYTARREEAGNHVQRFYLGEDPFGGSIYGREREYEGVKRSSRQQRGHGDEQRKSGVRYGATLGRPSGSSANHSSSYHSHVETTRAQTLPRKLRHSPPHHAASNHHAQTTSSVRRQLYADSPSANNSFAKSRDLQRHTGSLINVSIVNNVTPGGGPNGRAPPAKPARTYRSNLSRSKSFNVHGNQGDEVDFPKHHHSKPINGEKWESQASRYRSNPQLSRILHEESPLKSPGIISSINRSQRDLRDAVREENNTRFADMIRKEEGGLLRKKEWTPMNFKERNGIVSDKSGAGGRSESVRITTVSDGPSVTRTVRNFEKRSSGDGANGGSGRLETTYETTTTVTESRSRPPSIWNRNRKSALGTGFSESTGNGGVVIEVRNGRM